MVELTKTGIPGVDEMIGGGIPRASVVIVSGSPGIGKSNFALQFIYEGITKYNEPDVYNIGFLSILREFFRLTS